MALNSAWLFLAGQCTLAKRIHRDAAGAGVSLADCATHEAETDGHARVWRCHRSGDHKRWWEECGASRRCEVCHRQQSGSMIQLAMTTEQVTALHVDDNLVLCYSNGLYSVSQKSSPPKKKNFAIFSLGVNLCNWKLPLVTIAQTYSYVYTNIGPFIWIFVWIVSVLLVKPLKFSQFNFVYYEIHEFFVKNKSQQWYLIKYNSYAKWIWQ